MRENMGMHRGKRVDSFQCTVISEDMQMPDEFHGPDEGGVGIVYYENGEVISWGIVGPPGEVGIPYD